MYGIKYLQSKHLTHADRISAKEQGPPRPVLNIKQECSDRKRAYTRYFNKSLYEKCEWICGCEVSNAFFCFPCVLFGSDDKWWTRTGITDLKHLPDKIKKHGLSQSHLDNELSLALIGQINIREQLDEGYRISVKKHNEEVDKNRYILLRIIDAIKFCGEFELALRGHDETEDSGNAGVFKGLINYTAAIDSALRDHLDNAKVFKGTSKTIQNDLLSSMLSVYQQHIKTEISTVDYIALQADETTDNSHKSQLTVILRYVLGSEIKERFWGFFEVHDRSARGLAEIILQQLSEIGVVKVPEKLICQTYDGASVMRGEKGGVQCLIKKQYPNANYIHCYAHQGNLILQNATSSSSQSRIFFEDIQGIGPFFSRSPKRMDSLAQIVQRRIASVPPTRWYFQHRTVNSVYENKDSLIECFQHIRDTEINDRHTCGQAAGFARTLKDPQFLFWLEFYHKGTGKRN